MIGQSVSHITVLKCEIGPGGWWVSCIQLHVSVAKWMLALAVEPSAPSLAILGAAIVRVARVTQFYLPMIDEYSVYNSKFPTAFFFFSFSFCGSMKSAPTG